MRDYGYDTMNRDRYDREGRDDDRGLFGWDNREERHERRDFDRDRTFGPDQRRQRLARNETRSLIASNKVEGTPVYGRDGDQIGEIHNFMVEKRGGKIRYAVMKTSSGFLGLNERYYPLEWNELTYDTDVDGYHVDMTEDDLERRRSFDASGRPTEIGRNRDYHRDYDRDYDRNRYERSTW